MATTKQEKVLCFRVILTIFYIFLVLAAVYDLKQFSFHLHYSRLDRVPYTMGDDPISHTIFFSLTMGILGSLLIISFVIAIIYGLWQLKTRVIMISCSVLLAIFSVRFIINIITNTKNNGRSSQALAFFSVFSYASGDSLVEENFGLLFDFLYRSTIVLATFYIHCCIDHKSSSNNRSTNAPIYTPLEFQNTLPDVETTTNINVYSDLTIIDR
ncbi:unnamed protein product [Didymodactylos carnosus]|uniref:Uncharacterized protein n=1 Tax=Didymodactylos carnosus TaxID=1234261 RepID=A0A815D1Y4_9BILA|nr:unnamed protein product [Didymodactylos carnosus]CAF1398733.1 unnamed protein product [Didymodactylos carnosus]CAF4097687.1 unnamed protein product [Didymodactylos carnosus]CAF4206163.1 unnamed protein product [Didymodactylos carnosus]